MEQRGHRDQGRKIVANTLLLSKVKFRADVNPVSKALAKKIREEISKFIWKGRRAGVRWEVLVKPEEEGGVGLKDPACTFDAAKIKLLTKLRDKDEQPWKRWMERRLRKVGARWGVPDPLQAKPTPKQRKELRESCLTESTLRIWFELGRGMTKEQMKEERYRKEEEERKKHEVPVAGVCPVAARDRRREKHRQEMSMMSEQEKSEMGLKTTTDWTPISEITTKYIYKLLIKKRLKTYNYQPNKAHENIQTIQRNLTAKERDYLWRMTHRLILTRKKESKYKQVQATCPVCREGDEDLKHYEYECPKVKEFIEEVKSRTAMSAISREQWKLEAKEMTKEGMTAIAKARWIHHKERCMVALGKKKQVNVQVMMNRLDRALEIVKEVEQKRKEKRRQSKRKRTTRNKHGGSKEAHGVIP